MFDNSRLASSGPHPISIVLAGLGTSVPGHDGNDGGGGVDNDDNDDECEYDDDATEDEKDNVVDN